MQCGLKVEVFDVSFLGPKELAEKLNVSVNTIYYWVHKKEIPYVKMGKHNRFCYEEVMNYFFKKTKEILKHKEENETQI